MDESRIARVNALTQEQRDAVYHAAKLRIAGRQPLLEDFSHHGTAQYSTATRVTIIVLTVLMLIASFLPSAMRIHEAGRIAFQTGINHETSLYLAAICVVLMAESGQIIFSLASSLMKGVWYQLAFVVGAVICTAIALTGNHEIAHGSIAEGQTQSAFAFLETYAPPILTLITAQVLKSQFLAADKRKTEQGAAFASALADWMQRVENAEQDHTWARTLAILLWDEIRNANKRSPALLREIADDERKHLVIRERKAQEWANGIALDAPVAIEPPPIPLIYANASAATPLLAAIEPPPASTAIARSAPVRHASGKTSTKQTGEIASAQLIKNADGTFVKVCPECGFHTPPNATKRGAINALVAHHKSHKNAERKAQEALT